MSCALPLRYAVPLLPDRRYSASSSPPTKLSPGDWQYPCRRYPVQNRDKAHTSLCCSHPVKQMATCRSNLSASRLRPTKYHQKYYRSKSRRIAWAHAPVASPHCLHTCATVRLRDNPSQLRPQSRATTCWYPAHWPYPPSTSSYCASWQSENRHALRGEFPTRCSAWYQNPDARHFPMCGYRAAGQNKCRRSIRARS